MPIANDMAAPPDPMRAHLLGRPGGVLPWHRSYCGSRRAGDRLVIADAKRAGRVSCLKCIAAAAKEIRTARAAGGPSRWGSADDALLAKADRLESERKRAAKRNARREWNAIAQRRGWAVRP